MARPFVSVLIDTYNHERFIEQAIVSVLEQDFPVSDREIIVVDDGSTDRTPDIVRKFEPRVRLLRKSNGGQASAFNAGIPECRGEMISFLDGDDWWAPEKLSRVTAVLEANPGVGMVGHAYIESFDDGSQRTIVLEQSERLKLDSVRAAGIFRLHKGYLGTKMTLRAEIARKTLPVPEVLVIEADEYLFTLAAALDEFVILVDALMYYRLHGTNLYMSAGGNVAGLRRKQNVLAALAVALSDQLTARGLSREIVRCVTEIVEAEAEQLRLALDGGLPWATYRTEETIYRILHANATWKQRKFRKITMIAALCLPPKWFYRGRQWLASQAWYLRARRRFLPVPSFTKVQAPGIERTRE